MDLVAVLALVATGTTDINPKFFGLVDQLSRPVNQHVAPEAKSRGRMLADRCSIKEVGLSTSTPASNIRWPKASAGTRSLRSRGLLDHSQNLSQQVL